MAEQPLVLQPREVARLLGISVRTLWRWTHEGRVPYIRIGRTVRFPYAVLTAWLEEQSHKPASAPVKGQDVEDHI